MCSIIISHIYSFPFKSSPYRPHRRRPINSRKMDSNSGDCKQSPSRSQGSKYAREDGSTCLPHTNSKDDDGYDDDSGTTDEHLTKKPERTKENTASANVDYRILVYIILPVLAVVVPCLYLGTKQDTEKVKQMSLRDAIEHIREEFPSQLEHIWGEFSAGISETAQGTPTKPSVFMLLYETEEGTAICLAQKVCEMSTRLLKASKSNPLLIIDGADLEHNETLAEDYGRLLEEYRPKVEEQRAMIINNLHKIPGTVAQSFHSFCDTVSPIVDKAVYLFTMKASGVISNRHNPTEVAEEELRKLWSDELAEDKLNPLVTRITDITMMIRPEKNLAPCES